MSGTELGKAGRYVEGTSDSDEGARLSWRAFKWLLVGALCVIAAVTIWAIAPKWVDVGSVETAKAEVLSVHTGGQLRIVARQVSGGAPHALTMRLTADTDTVPIDAAHPRGFSVTRVLSDSGSLRLGGLVPGYYSLKVVPARGSTWLVDVEDHRSWWSLPW